MDESDLQCEKQDDPRISTFRGILSDSSDESENAKDLIRVNRKLDSNETDESDLHPEKYHDPRVSTFRGLLIDSSDESENVEDSIRVNFDWNSNNIDLIVLQSEQHFAAKAAVESRIHPAENNHSAAPNVKHFQLNHFEQLFVERKMFL
jgi:hypothetical protein